MTHRIGIFAAITLSVSACSEPSSPPREQSVETPVQQPPQPTLPGGTLAFVSVRDGKAHIYIANVDGSGVRRITSSDDAEFTPAWSPDGQQLAFARNDGIFVIRRDGSGLARVYGSGGTPSWSPDGKRVMVATKTDLRVVAADGSGANEVAIDLQGAVRTTTYQDGFLAGASWSPDGSRIAFSAWTDSDFQRAFVVNLDGSAGRTFVKPFNNAIWDECAPAWSPDGKKLALLGGVFGSAAFMHAYFGVGIIDPDVGNVTPIYAPGTTCWDWFYQGPTSSAVAWSPDAKSLAISQRTPGWSQDNSQPGNQAQSIVIVDIETKAVLATIQDAYDPTWTSAR